MTVGAKPVDRYTSNPLVHRDRRLANSPSPWVRSFACDDMRVLVVCRGPIRKEAIEVFREMGMTDIGILLSERDSIVFPRALSPELRIMDPRHVHPVPDYTGTTKEEREERIQQIIGICKQHGYGYVFAGYGFMAEDAHFVGSIETAGLRFIGPCAYTQAAAGAKDEAKRTAILNQVSVTPGINDATVRTLLRKCPDRATLRKAARRHNLEVPLLADEASELHAVAEAVLEASYRAHVDLFSIEELAETIRIEAERLLRENPGRRFRLKAIGGGGGKGQRIFSAAEVVPSLVREVLGEVKATGAGDNKNMLIELNVEATRHNEIQMLGNGEWCVTLGGRDCSLQMHEQKLVEVSITQEGLRATADRARAEGDETATAVLEADLAVLSRMEAEAERFGRAVKLDSASTFECIVEGNRHYFMEVNTRIQVEHRVSELCYALRFANPGDPTDFFDIHSLVEAMALVAKHKTALPQPARVPRDGAAIEVRLNATDRALQPAAGGLMIHWSDPVDGEIRDDQGISLKNPDTGMFIRYRLAGAYDSNIALLLSTGAHRVESWARLTEVLRRTRMRGNDLATNLEFHFGIMKWFLHRDPWAKPTTQFVVPYLTLVGLLEEEAQSVDLNYAFREMERRQVAKADREAVAGIGRAYDLKETLVERPIRRLFEEPHYLSAWLSQHMHDFDVSGGCVTFKRNPVAVLWDTYRLLNYDEREGPATERIWDHDAELLLKARDFYAALRKHTRDDIAWPELDRLLCGDAPAFGFDADTWDRVRAAHVGHQLGLEILGIVPLLGAHVGFFELRVRPDLEIEIPERLRDRELQEAMKKVLVPPPATRSDEIVAAMGGTYWNREAPHMPMFVEAGDHFEKGQPLYIIEVMKMFNKVYATFSGRVLDVFVHESGTIVRKGQPLFRVAADEKAIEEDPTEKARRIRMNTNRYVASLLREGHEGMRA
ncbi:biotin carboxylase [Candidatus Binatia bacterium]|nr:biotin carboxylase [Candidatus Binatia bacterium]